MRHFMIPSVMALVLSVSSSAWADDSYRLRVDGLACPFCAYGIEKQFKNTEGVKGIDIRINDGLVFVTVADGDNFDETRARQIVKETGFTLRGFEKITEVR